MVFIVVEDVNVQSFIDEVNALLAQGWKLHGGMIRTEGTYVQALTHDVGDERLKDYRNAGESKHAP